MTPSILTITALMLGDGMTPSIFFAIALAEAEKNALAVKSKSKK